ncbi:MAG: SRPBCC family protein [bacterium]|jgi:uncharacterized membrane protein
MVTQAQDLEKTNAIRVEESIIINQPVETVYSFWRNLSNLPQVMQHVKEVNELSPTRSHWRVKGPLGIDAEWDAEIVVEHEHEMISWQSVKGSRVSTAGSVHFKPIPNGAEVKVLLQYDPPGGALGDAIARTFGRDPHHEIRRSLQQLKYHLEKNKSS